MYDFHIHSRVSFDGRETGLAMAQAAKRAGLTEICFTDHIDYDPQGNMEGMAFSDAAYSAEYDALQVPGLTIRRGIEFGMTPDNRAQFQKDLRRREFDFVLGSVHFVDGLDVYFPEYWADKTQAQAEDRYLEATLECVRQHEDFDVLAHLTYISKATGNPAHRPIPYRDHARVVDEIFLTLIRKGKGLELNTSGVDRCGVFLPDEAYFRRFRELGGRIVTVGSDAHDASRVGQYAAQACALLGWLFGGVYTFQNRQPVFHPIAR